jgi:hypothetical protein
MKKLKPADYLKAPRWKNTKAIRAEWDRIFQAARDQGPNTLIDYTSDQPKAAFLSHLVAEHKVLIHGSNNPSIVQLKPKPQTDYLGRPVRVIFAAADGIWPIFFAVLDREIYEGTIRNGCFWVTARGGRRHKGYHFSINARLLKRDPWTDGMIYILPHDSFEQERDLADNPLEEWVSAQPVTPLARLAVTPADFPFLREVQGHEENHLERLEAGPAPLFKGFAELIDLPDGYAIRYTGDRAWDALLMEFIRAQRRATPALTYGLLFEPHDGPISLQLRGPEGMKDAIRDRLHTFLDARNAPAYATLPERERRKHEKEP